MRFAMVLLLLSLSRAALVFGQETRATPEVHAGQSLPLIELQTSQEIVSRGQRMHVAFVTARNAFVAILRIDTDGRVRWLYPERPWHDSYVEAGRLFEVQNPACANSECAFVIDDYPGQGYVFALASQTPFDFEAFSNGDYWAYTAIAHRGRVTGDPYVAMSDLIDRLIPESAKSESSFDVFPYYVGLQYEYPRFLCYECHSFVRYPAWNPYLQSCSRFQVVRYEDPAYEPISAFGDTRVVLARPQVLEPRFVFEKRDVNDPFVFTGRERPTSPSPGRAGASALDVGGVGSVPAPLGRRGTASDSTLRWLSPLERAIYDGRVGSMSSDSSATRRQPHLRRRVATKPDSSGESRQERSP